MFSFVGGFELLYSRALTFLRSSLCLRKSPCISLSLAFFALASTCRAEEFLTCHAKSASKIVESQDSYKIAPRALEEKVKNILHDFAGDDISAYFGITPAIMVTGDSAPNAYVTRVNEIVLSKGLLKVVESTAELAFVVAHELGHIMLGHNATDSAHYAFTGDSSVVRDSIAREIQADSFALKLMSASGFEPRSGILLLARLARFGSEQGLALTQSYPSLEARLTALNGQLAAPLCGSF